MRKIEFSSASTFWHDRARRLVLRDLTIYPLNDESLAEMKGTRRRTEAEDRKQVWPQQI